MKSGIEVNHEVIDGMSFSFVTQDASEALRAAVVLPFDTVPINAQRMSQEAPHVMEHVVCSGDGTMTPAKYNEYKTSKGGSYNALTTYSNNGLLNFHTIQPDDGIDIASYMVNSTFNPALSQVELDNEREIVRNELRGYLQNPSRQRSITMGYARGTRYATDESGIASLDGITVEEMQKLHNSTFTRQNARIVLAGSPRTAQTLAERIATDNAALIPNGGKLFTSNSDFLPVPDYHAIAVEKPVGSTEYSHSLVSNHSELGIEPMNELRLAINALSSFMQSGEFGIHHQSRIRHLSYGLNLGWSYSETQIAVSVSDTTETSHVLPQIALLDETLRRAEQYTVQDFDEYRAKQVGVAKMYPEDLLSFSSTVENAVAGGYQDQIVTPGVYRDMLISADGVAVVEAVKVLIGRLQSADFIVRHSFGDNPF